MNQSRALEIVLIGGFLGSGKTTLLKRLLTWEIEHGTKPIVIMNEFGELDIDSRLIDNGQIEIRRLSGRLAERPGGRAGPEGRPRAAVSAAT